MGAQSTDRVHLLVIPKVQQLLLALQSVMLSLGTRRAVWHSILPQALNTLASLNCHLHLATRKLN